MTRGLYLDLENFGEYLAQQTTVTFHNADEGLIRFQLNDQTDKEGNKQHISYNREADINSSNQDVIAAIVEGERNQWEELLEPDTTSKTSSLMNRYSVKEVEGEEYIVANEVADDATGYR